MKKNAIILAAGTSSRFVPLSEETPKGLIEVKGEVLLERQIRQLKEAGIDDITLVVGFMAERFKYLEDKFGVRLVMNEDYARYNNTSSIMRVLDLLGNTYILTSDNYYPCNPFENDMDEAYYSAQYAEGATGEYCMWEGPDGVIDRVEVGGSDAWYMYGPVYFDEAFSRRFVEIMRKEYDLETTRKGYWEDVYIRHLDQLRMKVKKRKEGEILEFDSLDELREFDDSYIRDTRSAIVKEIAETLGCGEDELHGFKNLRPATGISFRFYRGNEPMVYTDGRLRVMMRYDMDSLRGYLAVIFPEKDLSGVKISRIGGMSNKNFLVELGDECYVLRVPGPGSEDMVSRDCEGHNSELCGELDITPRIRYFDRMTGIKLSDYMNDAETQNSVSIQCRARLRQVADIYRKLHSSNLQMSNEFNLFHEIEKYEIIRKETGAKMYAGWKEIRPRVMALKQRLIDLGIELKPCHNDPVPENFILDENGRLYIIDWEYSGMNDPVAELASLFLESDFTDENRDYLLREYYGGEVPRGVGEKILIYQVLWDILWSIWTVIKENKGDDFGNYGPERYKRALNNLEKVEK